MTDHMENQNKTEKEKPGKFPQDANAYVVEHFYVGFNLLLCIYMMKPTNININDQTYMIKQSSMTRTLDC